MEEVFVQKFSPFLSVLFPEATANQVLLLAKNLIHALHAKSQLIDQTLASLPPKLDACWHVLLLETDLYKEFCDTFCGGRFVRHTTTTQSTDVKVVLLKALVIACGNEPDEEVWSTRDNNKADENNRVAKRGRVDDPAFNIYIKNLHGKLYTYSVRASTPTKKLFEAVSAFFGITENAVRLVHFGHSLENDSTPVYLNGIVTETTLHLVERLRGC